MTIPPSIETKNIFYHPTPANTKEQLINITVIATAIIFTTLGIITVSGWIPSSATATMMNTVFFKYVGGGILIGLGVPVVAISSLVFFANLPKNKLIIECGGDKRIAELVRQSEQSLDNPDNAEFQSIIRTNLWTPATMISLRAGESLEHHFFDQASLGDATKPTPLGQFIRSAKELTQLTPANFLAFNRIPEKGMKPDFEHLEVTHHFILEALFNCYEKAITTGPDKIWEPVERDERIELIHSSSLP